MAALYFSIETDYQKVVTLKNEIKKLETELQKVGQDTSPEKIKKLQDKLADAKKEMQALADRAALAAEEMKDMGKQGQASMQGLQNTAKDLAMTMGGMFALGSVKEFIGQIVNVRGEFQQLEASFKNILQSKEKADALMSQLVETAATTPFDLKSVASGAKGLLAYGTEAQDVNETLVRLGDIAAGLNIPLGDMTYLFGTTMTAGRMYTQDLNQFLGRGIPLAEELAKQFGVGKDKVKGLVESGKVGAEEVKRALWSMTDAGSQFGGLMEAQSKTILGQISNLEDGIDMMFNELGQQNEGLISSIIGGVGDAVENYKTILSVLKTIIVTYGTYKAAVMTVAAVQKVNAKISYASEMAELQKLLPAKEANKQADIDAAVAKGHLTEAQANQIKAMRTEVEARANVLKAAAAEALAEKEAAIQKVQKAEIDYAIAESSQKRALRELEIQKSLGNASKIQLAQKELELASEQKRQAAQAAGNARAAVTLATQKAQTAATAANTAANNANAVSKTALTKATNLFTLSMQKLKAAVMSNPYGLLLAAVVSLCAYMYKLVTATTESDKAIAKVRDGFHEAEGSAMAETERLNILRDSLGKLTEGTEEYAETKKELINLAAKYDSKLAEEIEKVGLTAEAYGKLTEKIQKVAMEKQYQSTVQSLQEDYANAAKENLGELNEMFEKQYGKDKGKALFRQFQEAYSMGKVKLTDEDYGHDIWGTRFYGVETGSEELDEAIKKIGLLHNSGQKYVTYLLNAQKALQDGLVEADDIYKSYDREIQKKQEFTKAELRKQAQDAYAQALQAIQEAEKSGDAKKLKEAQEKLDDSLNAYVNAGGKDDSLDVYKEAKRRAENELAAAKKAWDEVQAKEGATLAERNNAKSTLDDAQKKYDALVGKDSKTGKGKAGNTEKERLKAQEELAKKLQALMKSNEQSQIDLMEEGKEKRLALINKEHSDRLKAIDEQAKEFAKLNKTAGTKGTGKDGLTDKQRQSLQEAKDNEGDRYTDSLDAVAKEELELARKNQEEYLKQYGTFQEKRKTIAEDYDRRIAEEQDEWRKKSLENEKASALGQLDLEQITKSDAYAKAFSDMGNASTVTLQNLATQIGFNKEKFQEAFAANPEQMKAFQEMLTKLDNELTARDPFGAIKSGFEELGKAQTKLDTAKAKVQKLKDELNLLTKDSAEYKKKQEEVNAAMGDESKAADEVQKANNKIKKAINTVVDEFGKVQSGLSAIGDEIGGIGGQAINILGDILNVVQVSVNGMNTAAEAGSRAMQAVERASVILAIIGAALKIMQKLEGLFGGDKQAEQYEKAVQKQSEVNKLEKAVRDYEAAVIAAQNAEKGWFSTTGIDNLQRKYEEGSKALDNYYHKAQEQQVKYQDQQAGRTGLGKATEKATKALGKQFVDAIINPVEWAKDQVTVATAGWINDTNKFADDYQSNMVSAVDNLRIETKARQHGTWLRKGKAQETQDLRTWVKENMNGADLFGADGMIDTTVAQSVIDTYGDKLQGATKETLEQLIEYKEQWDEYIETLQDYVSEMYSPVVDNMTDALMNWLDTGEDVMDKFQEDAGDTFRNVAKEMVKSMAQEKIFNSYGDKLKDLYKQQAEGKITRDQLMQQLAQATKDTMTTASEEVKALQDMLLSVDEAMSEAGVNIRNTDSTEQEATKGAFQTMSEDTASELNGRFTALQISGERVANGMESILTFAGRLDDLTSISTEARSIAGITEQIADIMSQSYLELQGIRENTGAIVEPIVSMQADIRKMSKKLEEM